jgi:hypothetical protein
MVWPASRNLSGFKRRTRRQRYLDGARSRGRSSRRRARGTPRHGALRWRRTKRRPAPPTIAPVRRHHLEPRRDGCRAVTLVGQPRARCGGEVVAREGRQFSAVHATGRHFTTAPRAPVRAQRAARVAGSLPALEAAAAPDAAGPPDGARAAARQTTSAARCGRRRRAAALQAAVARRGPHQRSRTDPERRAMQAGTGGVRSRPDGRRGQPPTDRGRRCPARAHRPGRAPPRRAGSAGGPRWPGRGRR